MIRTQGAPEGEPDRLVSMWRLLQPSASRSLVLLAGPSGAAEKPPDSVPAAGPIVRCEPVSITGLANGIVTADVYIQDVVALYGADVQLSFDVSIVQVLDENPNSSGIQIQPLALFSSPVSSSSTLPTTSPAPFDTPPPN